MNPYVYAITPPSGSSGGVAETEVPILQQIANNAAASAGAGGGWGYIVVNGTVYSYDYQEWAYYDAGSTNVKTIKFRSGGAAGTVVGTQTFAYVGNPITTANLSIAAISLN